MDHKSIDAVFRFVDDCATTEAVSVAQSPAPFCATGRGRLRRRPAAVAQKLVRL
jgi:hypothetical protein